MPLYEYRCRQCGHQFELIQKFSDPPPERCEKCGGGVEKLLSAPAGLQFKGSGFYITDYARKDKKETKPKKEPAASTPAEKKPAPSTGSGTSDSGGSTGSGGTSTPPASAPTSKS